MSTPGELLRAEDLTFRVSTVRWFPDGGADWLAVGGISGSDFNQGVLTVLPARPGEPRWTRTDVEPVEGVAVSPDRQWLAVAGWQNVVVSAADGTHRFAPMDQFQSFTAEFSPDGSLAAWHAGVFEVGTWVKIVDAATGAIRLEIPRADALRWAWAPDSRHVATLGTNAVDVFDVGSGEPASLPLASAAVDVAYSPGGRWLAAACIDGTVPVFDATSGQAAHTVQVGGGPVAQVAFSPDGRWLFADAEHGVGIYDAADGTEHLPAASGRPSFTKAAFSPDLRSYASRSTVDFGPGVAVLDAATGETLWQDAIADFVNTVAYSTDGALVTVGTSNAHETGSLRTYSTGVEVSRHQHDTPVTAITMAPAGTPLIAIADTAPAVTVLTAETGTRLARKPVPGTLAAFLHNVEALDSSHTQAIASDLGDIAVPAHVVWGAADPFQKAEWAPRLRDAIPGATLRLVDSGHFVPWERPDELSTEIRELAARS